MVNYGLSKDAKTIIEDAKTIILISTLTPFNQEGRFIKLATYPKSSIHQANMTIRLWKVTPLTTGNRIDILAMQAQVIGVRQKMLKYVNGFLKSPHSS